MPYIEEQYPIDNTKRCLFGHTLSGYFTLWVKFTRPELFQAYLSASPSVW
ncbi:alpha/beta hydrolase-fold protein [Paenibacillus crassostreae]